MAKLAEILGEAYKEGMTPEEIESALEGVTLPSGDTSENAKEIERLKAALTKSNSENADWKKKFREKQTDEERKASEDAEKMTKLQSAYDELVKENSLSKFKAQYLGLGYPDDLAAETAEAMLSGETEKVFANQKKYQEIKEKELRATILKDTPAPPAGAGAAVKFDEDIANAYARGDWATAAALMRQQQEAASNPKK